ncbi:malate dehydrogenase, partial [Arsenicicoccus sp. UBA2120]
RADLLAANGKIFTGQGAALNKVAPKAKVLVTGNPANTNALIAMNNAPDMAPEQFNALTRLDHNRAKSMLAKKLGVGVAEIKDLAIWGNHDDSMYPDLFNTKVNGKAATELVDEAWITGEYIPTVATRGGAIIKARGASSAASAANATIDHMRDWMLGTDEIVSMSVPSDGSYGVPEGIISSFPCRVKDGKYEIVQGLELNDFSRERIMASAARLESERDQVKALGLIS